MEDIAKLFGKRLQQIRKMRRLTQAQLAELVELEVSTISRIEQGTQYPKPENVSRFVEVLNVDVKDLFESPKILNKSQLLASINYLLAKASVQDLQFYNKMILNHIEYKNYKKEKSGTFRSEKI